MNSKNTNAFDYSGLDVLLPLCFCAPIYWYKTAAKANSVTIEKHAFFEKSTYRNRCEVTGPNGLLTLSVPKEGGKNKKAYYKDVSISYDHEWQKDHWNGLQACYRRSPYFEYYEHRFEPFFNQQHESLYAFNTELLTLTLELLSLDVAISYTEEYKAAYKDRVDLRPYFRPSKRKTIKPYVEYTQVFQEKTGFIPNASILDLLFNEGPASHALLMK